MEVEKAIKTKRDIRKYDQTKQVNDTDLLKILEAGRLAQSSKNYQPVRFIVIRDKNKLEGLSKCTYSGDFLTEASVGIAIVTEDAKLPEIDSARLYKI
jgi:nitroreductase